MNDVNALLDDHSGVPIAMRISDFVEAAAAHGYSPEDGEEFTLPGLNRSGSCPVGLLSRVLG
jgi:hypothetical protein